MAQHDDDERRQRLSALMDGEGDGHLAAHLCSAWRDDAVARQAWYAWHLIGDVLRSDDLAAPARDDARFMTALRARLGAEPVVIAPRPLPERERPSRRWAAAAAVAGGFGMVVAAMLVLNASAPAPDAPVLAGAAPAPAQTLVAAPTVAVAPAEPQVVIADSKLIRDARLDRYLAAHKPVGGNPALAMPTGFSRARADAAR